MSDNIDYFEIKGFKFKTILDEDTEMFYEVYVFDSKKNNWEILDDNCMEEDVSIITSEYCEIY